MIWRNKKFILLVLTAVFLSPVLSQDNSNRFSLSVGNCTDCLNILQDALDEISRIHNISVSLEDRDECAHSDQGNCSDFAVCINYFGSYECMCLPGFVDEDPTFPGTVCTDINECDNQTASNCLTANMGGSCDNTNGSFACRCLPGYSGDGMTTCSDIDECDLGSHNCSQNANCTNANGTFECSCVNGYEGDGFTCNNINECESDLNPCRFDSHSFCNDTSGTFTCECISGFVKNNGTCVDVDECDSGMSVCAKNQVCVNRFGHSVCRCANGYRALFPNLCLDINECALGTANCQSPSVCQNTAGSFQCLCPENQVCDNTTDLCSNSSLNNCHINAKCSNVDFGISCSCKNGFYGNGISCMDINECWEGDFALCGNNAVCMNTPGSFYCNCSEGFEMVQNICRNINECSSNPCGSNATCTDTVGSFMCQCNSGFTGDGFNCTESPPICPLTTVSPKRKPPPPLISPPPIPPRRIKQNPSSPTLISPPPLSPQKPKRKTPPPPLISPPPIPPKRIKRKLSSPSLISPPPLSPQKPRRKTPPPPLISPPPLPPQATETTPCSTTATPSMQLENDACPVGFVQIPYNCSCAETTTITGTTTISSTIISTTTEATTTSITTAQTTITGATTGSSTIEPTTTTTGDPTTSSTIISTTTEATTTSITTAQTTTTGATTGSSTIEPTTTTTGDPTTSSTDEPTATTTEATTTSITTTQTTTTETTTSPPCPRFDILVNNTCVAAQQYNIVISFNTTFTPQLQDVTSSQYDNTSAMHATVLTALSAESSFNYGSISNLTFTQGSVIATGIIEAASNESHESLEQIINDVIVRSNNLNITGNNVKSASVSRFNECVDFSWHDCHENAICTDLDVPPGFNCSCNPGYIEKNSTHMGRSCEPQCLPDGSPYCLNGGTCIIVPGADKPLCRCPPIYVGERCENVDGALVAAIVLGVCGGIFLIFISVLLFYIKCRGRSNKYSLSS